MTGGPLRPTARLRRAARLTWRTRRQVAVALVLFPAVAWRLRSTGYRATGAWLDARVPSGARVVPIDGAGSAAQARELGFAVRIAARPIPDATCLRRSLVHRHLAVRVGVPAVVRLGARQEASGDLDFHAWVEVDGEVVSEDPRSISGYVAVDDPGPGRP